MESVTLAIEQRLSLSVKKEPEVPAGRVCGGCDLKRTAKEFAGMDCTFKFCAICRSRNPKLREVVR